MPRPDDVGVGVGIVLARIPPGGVIGDCEVLLIQRQGAHAAGAWSVPGGWVDFEDTHPIDTVRREAVEEVGVSIRHAKLIGVTSEWYPEFRSVTLYYLACAWQDDWRGEPEIREPNKCSELIWHPLRRITPQPAYPGLKDGLGYAWEALWK